MKVGILTFHFAHNIGAMAQAYALSSYINSLGHRCEIIDYRPEYMYDYLEDTTICNYYYKKVRDGYTKLNAFVNTLRFSPFILRDYLLNRNPKPEEWVEYNSFMQKYLPLSRRYRKLKNLNRRYDVIITGSDQVWNCELTNDYDLYYFLNIDGDFKRISYAASSGYDTIPNILDNIEDVRSALIRFDAISCREQALSNYVSKITGMPVPTVCDPVFLLTKQQWLNLIDPTPIIKEPYLLVHDIHNDEIISKIAQKYAANNNLKIVSTGWLPLNIKKDDCLELKAGPLKFLNLIKNASIVVSNSFHAISLSLIFNKPLIPISSKIRNERVKNLMIKLNILEFLVDIHSLNASIIPVTNYRDVNSRIYQFKEFSSEFLSESIIK